MLQCSTTQKLQFTPGTTGGDLAVSITYTDRSGTTDSPGQQDTTGTITGTAAVDVLAVPSAGVRRVRWLNARNKSATITSTYLLTKVDSTGPTTYELIKVTLAPGEELMLSGTGVWFVYASDGSVKSSNQPGRLLRITRYAVAGSGNHVIGPDCNNMYVTVVGGGAGGGGCTSVASASGAGGGGGSGAKCERFWANVAPSSSFAYTVGANGAGVSGAAGGNGSNSTFTGPGGVVLTAPGGVGGTLGTAATTLTARQGGDGGALATNGDINKGGNPGLPGIVLIPASAIGVGGNGGSGTFGDGGLGSTTAGNGAAGTGNGSGGAGAFTGASAVRTGGNGAPGIIIVEEYS